MKRSIDNSYIRYQQQSSQQQSQEDQYQISKNKANKKNWVFPRFIKNKIDQANINQIVLNVSKTHYQIVAIAGEQMGWKIQRSKKSQKWDIMWIDGHIQAHDLFKLNDYQKISHFPAISILARKDLLGRGLMKMNKFFPQQYNFFPSTWAIPSDYTDLILYNQSKQKQKQQQKQYYIFKPQASSQGKGIIITDNIQSLQQKTGVVQIYVNNPLLIEGLKFDLRIYVLIAGCDPLRIYIYQQGLGRFATQFYKKAKKKNIKQTCMHLTNYAINKLNNKFIFNNSQKSMNKGHKRSLTSVYAYLQKIGINTNDIKNKIDDLIIKTLIIGQPMLAHIYGLSQPDNFANDICFQILGFDILINDNLQPILLQVNHTPSFVTDTPLDNYIKKNLIKDTFKLLKVNIQTKKIKILQKQQVIQLRSQKKSIKFTNQQKNQFRKKAQIQRDQWEINNLGKFRKLYPNDNIKYIQMHQSSKQIFDQHYGFTKKKSKQIKINNFDRPISLQKNITQKNQKNGNLTQSTKPFKKQISTICTTKSTLQTSAGKFPSIQKSLKNSYVCPIISQINKIPFPKYRSKQHFMLKKQIIDNNPRGTFLTPKTLRLDQGLIQKQRIQKIQETLISSTQTVVNKIPIRKKLQCQNILKTLIFRKINQNQ